MVNSFFHSFVISRTTINLRPKAKEAPNLITYYIVSAYTWPHMFFTSPPPNKKRIDIFFSIYIANSFETLNDECAVMAILNCKAYPFSV